jgi:uncharacterized membrane protein required for colicin V production
MEHWLSVGAAVFLIGMMLYGHYRGFLRQCVSLGALLLTIIVVKLATPYTTAFIRENPVIRETASQVILNITGWEEPLEDVAERPAVQRMTIEELNLPQSVKDILLENNNSEVYSKLGVERFTEYISTYLADMLIRAVCSVLLFVVSYLLIHLLIGWLDLVSRLPIISGLNDMAGAVAGLAQGLLILWIAGFVVSLFSTSSLGMTLEAQIEGSVWLNVLYRYNLIGILLRGVIRGIF